MYSWSKEITHREMLNFIVREPQIVLSFFQ